jgi:beta-lactamase class A
MRLPLQARAFLLLLISFAPLSLFAQPDSLRTRIERLVAAAPGTVGVAVRVVETCDTVAVNGDQQFPTFSVYKFPIALAILDQVDKGRLSLDQKVEVRKRDLMPDTWSPLQRRYPGGSRSITIDTLLRYTVSQSDNNGCDILLKLVGGPGTVDRYIRRLGVKGMHIAATERQMRAKAGAFLTNWSTPGAMTALLTLFSEGKILSRRSTGYLRDIMEKTTTGPARIKGWLPEGTVVAHKTGSSGTVDSVTIATNDVGIVTLPGGRHVILSVFVKEARAEESACEEVIAGIAKAVWDAYVTR